MKTCPGLFSIAIALMIFPSTSLAQCGFLATATEGLTLQTASGTDNRSGVAWNPAFDLYYSVNAGSGAYPIETFLAAGGAAVSSPAGGISFRGLWWNSALGQLEGNGHGTTGLRVQDLDAVTGYALGTGTIVYAGQNQPNSQSCGDLDYDADEVIYYDNGSIYRYARSNGAALGNYPLTNNPGNLADILDYGVVYTGCAGAEIGIYDHTNRRVYFFDKSDGDYSTTVQLPATAPQPPSFGFSLANDMIWVFDGPTRVWHSYVFADPVPVELMTFVVE